MKILIIEHNETDVNEIVNMYLNTNSNNEVVVVPENLESVTKAIQEKRPDVILLDSSISENYDNLDDIPLVYITGLNDEEVITKANKYNPKAYLIKPFNREMLFTAIDNAVRLTRLENLIPKSFKDD